MASSRPAPITTLKDPAKYRRLQLKNGLDVLLVNKTEAYAPLSPITFPLASTLFDAESPEKPEAFQKYSNDGFRLERKLGPQIMEKFNLLEHSDPSNRNAPVPKKFLKGLKGCCNDVFHLDYQQTNSLNKCGEADSDPKIDKGIFTYAVLIKAGSFNDPSSYYGLAHYVEHIIHRGSSNYPGETSLENFLRKETVLGYYNAYTSSEETVYFGGALFTPDNLTDILSRYVDMFLNPSLCSCTMAREVESIEHEHQFRRTGNLRRILQILHTEGITGTHSLKNFQTGSKQTLYPNQRSIEDLQKQVQIFLKTHYRPKNMALVIEAFEDLDKLQEIVEMTFGRMQACERPLPSYIRVGCFFNEDIPHPHPYSMKNFNRLYTIKPESCDFHELHLFWPFSAEAWKNYKAKPMEYLVDACKEGLAQYLDSMKWSLGFHVGYFGNKFVTLFRIMVRLTNLGRDNLSCVLQAIFGHLNALSKQPISKARFEKLQKIANIQLQNLPIRSGGSFYGAPRLAQCMNKPFEPKDLITGNTLFQTFEPKVIKKYLNDLTPSMACYMLLTVDNGKTEYLTERWYNAKYLVQDLTTQMLRFIEKPQFPFPKTKVQQITEMEVVAVENQSKSNEYFRGDDIRYLAYPAVEMTPQTIAVVSIYSNSIDSNVTRSSIHLFDVWATMIELHVQRKKEFGYLTELGTFGTALSFGGLEIQTYGFHKLVKDMLNMFIRSYYTANCENGCKDCKELFQKAKEVNLSRYFCTVAPPHRYAIDMFFKLQSPEYLTFVERYDCLSKSGPEQLNQFIKRFRKREHFWGLVFGAVSRDDGTNLTQLIRANTEIPDDNAPEFDYVKPRYKQFPLGERCFRIKSLMPNEKTFVVMNVYQFDEWKLDTEEDWESFLFLFMIYYLLEPIVGELRQIEQLGYLNGLLLFRNFGQRDALGILVQGNSERHCVCHVDQRIDACVQKFLDTKTSTKVLKETSKLFGLGKKKPNIIQEYIQKHLCKKGKGYKKISIQVCPDNFQKMCSNTCSPKSKWLPPMFCVGKENVQVTLAGPDKSGGGKEHKNGKPIFITSFEGFHNGRFD